MNDTAIYSPSNDETKQVVGNVEQQVSRDDTSPAVISPTLEKWNKPNINIYRYLATIFSFVIMGMNDAAYGVSPPNAFQISTSVRDKWISSL